MKNAEKKEKEVKKVAEPKKEVKKEVKTDKKKDEVTYEDEVLNGLSLGEVLILKALWDINKTLKTQFDGGCKDKCKDVNVRCTQFTDICPDLGDEDFDDEEEEEHTHNIYVGSRLDADTLADILYRILR